MINDVTQTKGEEIRRCLIIKTQRAEGDCLVDGGNVRLCMYMNPSF